VVAAISYRHADVATPKIPVSVRHPRYGVGTVLFVRDGFPKAKVKFHDGEEKVPKDELTVLS